MRVGGIGSYPQMATIAAWRQAMAEPAGRGMMAFDGHGMTEHCTEGLSVAHVSAHERGHLNSYRMRALAEGYQVVSEDIDIRFEMRDGRLVAVAGEARARLEPQKRREASGIAPATEGPLPSSAGEAPPADDGADAGSDGTAVAPVAPDSSELERDQREAAGQARSAEAELSSLPATPRTEDERRRVADAERRKAEAEERLRSVDLALQAERLARMVAEQSAIIAGAVEAQTRVAAHIAYAANA